MTRLKAKSKRPWKLSKSASRLRQNNEYPVLQNFCAAKPARLRRRPLHRTEGNEVLRGRRDKKLSLIPVGKKGRDSLKRAGFQFAAEYVNVLSKVEFSTAREIAGLVSDLYAKEEIDAVYLIFSEFKTVVTANLVVEKLLPVEPKEIQEARAEKSGETAPRKESEQPESQIDYIYEQPVEKLLGSLL